MTLNTSYSGCLGDKWLGSPWKFAEKYRHTLKLFKSAVPFFIMQCLCCFFPKNEIFVSQFNKVIPLISRKTFVKSLEIFGSSTGHRKFYILLKWKINCLKGTEMAAPNHCSALCSIAKLAQEELWNFLFNVDLRVHPNWVFCSGLVVICYWMYENQPHSIIIQEYIKKHYFGLMVLCLNNASCTFG